MMQPGTQETWRDWLLAILDLSPWVAIFALGLLGLFLGLGGLS